MYGLFVQIYTHTKLSKIMKTKSHKNIVNCEYLKKHVVVTWKNVIIFLSHQIKEEWQHRAFIYSLFIDLGTTTSDATSASIVEPSFDVILTIS